MDKKIKTFMTMVLLSLVFPCNLIAETANEPWDGGGGDIEPPPAPINSGVEYLAIVAILLAAYFFYKTNFKTQNK